MLFVESPVPVATLGELKAHLRLEDEREDALLSGWLRSATEAVETELGVLFLERGVVETMVVSGGEARLSKPPVRLVEAVEFADVAGWQELVPETFRLQDGDGPAARLLLEVPGGNPAAIRVRYRAGGASSRNEISELVREAVIRLAAFWHGNRDAAETSGLPPSVRQMLAPLRTRRLR